MSDNLSSNRQVRNEQIVRDSNVNFKNGIKNYFHGDKNVNSAPIDFVCECSDINCNEQVTLSIDEYEKMHKRRDRFVIAKGHETPEVEKIVDNKNGMRIVEKHQLAP